MSEMSIIKFRIFGSQTCKDCIKLKKALEIYAIDFDFIDTDDPKNDKLCDDNKVIDLPHLQAYQVTDGRVIIQRQGYVSPLAFLRDLSAQLQEENFPRNLDLKGVRSSGPFTVQPTKKADGGCGCNNES
jgi:glutaredoxin